MASTLEWYFASLALAVNTFTVLIMYFLGNLIVAPLLNALGPLVTTPQVVPMWDMSYLWPSIAAILFIEELIIIIAYAILVNRRNTYDDYA